MNLLSVYCLALWCFHIFWSPNSVVETSLCMLLILFQTAQNIACSQVNASCLSPVPCFFLFLNSQLIPSCTKQCVSTGKCNLCASRPIFSIPELATYWHFKLQKKSVFTGTCCMRLPSHFFYSLIRNLFQTAQKNVFSQVHAACVSRPIFSLSLIHNLFLFPNSWLIRLTWPCQWTMSFVTCCFLFKRKVSLFY